LSDSVLLAKAILALGCSLAALIVWRARFGFQWSERSFDRLALAAMVLTRLAVFAGLYLILGYEVPSDVAAAYLPEARHALQGQLAYRDFFTTYAPLFPYVAAIPVFFWNSGKSIALLAIVLEAVGFPFWLKAYRGLIGEEPFRTAVVLYVFNPLFISTVAMGGQNHVWIASALGIAFFLLRKSQDIGAGLALAWAFVSVKFLVLLPLPAVFAYAKRTWAAVASFAAASGAVYGLFLLNGANVFIPIRFQRSQGQDSSANLPFLLSAFDIDKSSPLYIGCAAAIGGVVCLLLLRRWMAGVERQDLAEMANWAILLFLIALLFSKKSYTYYLICVGFPLCVFAALRAQRRVWMYLAALFFAVASIEPSMWYRWVNINELSGIPRLLAAGRLSPAQLGVFGFCEVFLVGSYVAIAALILRDLSFKGASQRGSA
jgi:hypothetical protein